MTVLILSATPIPVFGNASTANPWWMVPVLAGCFVIVGALIAFFSTRASDSRKANREKQERIMLETRESGLAFIQAVNQIVGLVKLQQTKTGRKPLETYLASLSDAIATLEEKWEYLELHAPEDALDAARELLKACLSLMIPTEDAEGTSRDLGEVNRRRHDFINVLRQASGVNPISKNIPDPIVRRKFVEDNSEMLTVIYERLRKI